jgi:diguanylate cyclase (GGDEF)-like protein
MTTETKTGAAKSKPVLPLNTATSSVEFLQHCQSLISEEISYKGILKKYVSILVDYFGLTQVAYFYSDDTVAEIEPKRAVVRFPPFKMIEEEIVQKIKPTLNNIVKQDQEAASGVCNLTFQSVDYFFVVFSDPTGRTGYLLWKQPPMSIKSPLMRQIKDLKTSALPLLDFVTRAVQQTCLWYARLDKTQSLLYLDEVTGLYSYRYLEVAIDSELKRLHRFHTPFSLLFIDLDNFKAVNDKFGHITGSSVLKQIGEVIKLAVRDVDNVIRYGGDEFVVVLIGANTRQAMQAAERVRSRVESTVFKAEDRSDIQLTVSIGVACCPEHGRDRKTILKLADETMYKSKKSGKNKVMSVAGGISESESPSTFGVE